MRIGSIFRMFLTMTLLTGAVYPLLVTAIGKLIAPTLSQGSLIEHEGKILGSRLIGQKFKDPKYFWPRPSFIDYKPLPSGGSNWALTNLLLKKAVDERKKNLLQTSQTSAIPIELLFASGSGVDPHIPLEAAVFQISRIANARKWNKEKESLIHRLVHEHSFSSLFLEYSYVNVLLLNISLDQL